MVWQAIPTTKVFCQMTPSSPEAPSDSVNFTEFSMRSASAWFVLPDLMA